MTVESIPITKQMNQDKILHWPLQHKLCRCVIEDAVVDPVTDDLQQGPAAFDQHTQQEACLQYRKVWSVY